MADPIILTLSRWRGRTRKSGGFPGLARIAVEPRDRGRYYYMEARFIPPPIPNGTTFALPSAGGLVVRAFASPPRDRSGAGEVRLRGGDGGHRGRGAGAVWPHAD